jgi:hypothetical protein
MQKLKAASRYWKVPVLFTVMCLFALAVAVIAADYREQTTRPSTGAVGTPALGVRTDLGKDLSNGNSKWAVLQLDSFGSLRVSGEGSKPTYSATSQFACDSTATDIAVFGGRSFHNGHSGSHGKYCSHPPFGCRHCRHISSRALCSVRRHHRQRRAEHRASPLHGSPNFARCRQSRLEWLHLGSPYRSASGRHAAGNFFCLRSSQHARRQAAARGCIGHRPYLLERGGSSGRHGKSMERNLDLD